MTTIELSINEIKTLYRILIFQYIPYEDIEAINLIRKLRVIIEEYECQAGSQT